MAESTFNGNRKIDEALQLLNEAARDKKDEFRRLLSDKYLNIKETLTEVAMNNKEVIKGLLKDNPQGLTIQELTDKTKLAWNTVTKNLAKIEGEGNLIIREVGRAKLHSWDNKKQVKKNGKDRHS